MGVDARPLEVRRRGRNDLGHGSLPRGEQLDGAGAEDVRCPMMMNEGREDPLRKHLVPVANAAKRKKRA